MTYMDAKRKAGSSQSSNSAMFACAGAAASILMIRALSLSLGVLLVAVLSGLLISLVLLRGSR